MSTSGDGLVDSVKEMQEQNKEKTKMIAKLQAYIQELEALHAKEMKALMAKLKDERAAHITQNEKERFRQKLNAKPDEQCDEVCKILPERGSYVRVSSCTIPGYNIEAGEGWVHGVRYNNKGGLEFQVHIPVLNRTVWVPPKYIRCQQGKGDASMLQVKLGSDGQSSSHYDCLSYHTPTKQDIGVKSASRGKTKRPTLSEKDLKRKFKQECHDLKKIQTGILERLKLKKKEEKDGEPLDSKVDLDLDQLNYHFQLEFKVLAVKVARVSSCRKAAQFMQREIGQQVKSISFNSVSAWAKDKNLGRQGKRKRDDPRYTKHTILQLAKKSPHGNGIIANNFANKVQAVTGIEEQSCRAFNFLRRRLTPEVTEKSAKKRNHRRHVCTAPEFVLRHGKDLRKIAEEYGWPDYPGCEKGTCRMPACALIYSDEVTVTKKPNGSIRMFALGHEIPIDIQMPDTESFNLSIVITVGFDGTLHAPQAVFSGSGSSVPADILDGLSNEFGITFSQNGSVEKSRGVGTDDSLLAGNTHAIARHQVETTRKKLGTMLKNTDVIIRAEDACGCHACDRRIAIYQEDNQVIFTNPGNTTHFLALNDHKLLNGEFQKHVQELKRKYAGKNMPITKNRLLQIVDEALFKSFTRTNVMTAVEKMGYTCTNTPDGRQVLDFSAASIQKMINTHNPIYVIQPSTSKKAKLRDRTRLEQKAFMNKASQFFAEHGYCLPRDGFTHADLVNLRMVHETKTVSKKRKNQATRFTRNNIVQLPPGYNSGKCLTAERIPYLRKLREDKDRANKKKVAAAHMNELVKRMIAQKKSKVDILNAILPQVADAQHLAGYAKVTKEYLKSWLDSNKIKYDVQAKKPKLIELVWAEYKKDDPSSGDADIDMSN